MSTRPTIEYTTLLNYKVVKFTRNNCYPVVFAAVPVHEIINFKREAKINTSNIYAAGRITDNESRHHLDKLIPYVFVRDHSQMKSPDVKSYACCMRDGWTDTLIHLDARSAFKCILEKLGAPEAMIIFKEV